MFRRVLVAACLVCLSVSLTAAEETVAIDGTGVKDPLVGKKVADFTLRDFHGNNHSLDQYRSKKAVVLVFLGTECPLAKLYAPRLAELSKELAPKGAQLLAIDSNVTDSPTKMTVFAQNNHLDFPFLRDANNELADKIGATRTPEVFVLDAQHVVRYHGRIDDQYAVGVQREKVNRRFLAEAVEQVVTGKQVTQSATNFNGCLIARARKIAPTGDITYTKHVAKIMNAHCVECHRENELAPFTLTKYEEIVGWADTIREVVSQDRMPPWFADPKYGKFSNDCSLSAADKTTLLTWLDNGCPQGNPADLPPAPEFATGWRIGKPDGVYRMPQPYAVPAEGTVEYQHFMIDPELKEDVWVSAAEARPGNPAVVHHIVLFALPPGANLTGGDLAEAQRAGKMLAIYSPGMPPWKYPAGTAIKIEAGTKFVIQAHYTPNGLAQEDASYVGLKFVPASSVKRTVRYGMAVNAFFTLQPNAPDTEVTSKHKFPKDFLLLNLFPHMHFRGKSFRFEAKYPDGRKEVLLDVPRYDFNWQLRYDFTEPKLMPKGTELMCIAHFDNSDANPQNPDPSQTVRFGLQSWEEMMVGYYTIVPAEEDRVAAKKASGGQGQ